MNPSSLKLPPQLKLPTSPRLRRTGRRTRRRTGKLILLFTIVCAGQLYGMGPERGRYVGLGDLPRETQVIIVTYLQTNDNLDGTIAAIKEASKGVGLANKQLNAIVNEVYGIPKGFTALVHLLADKFNTSTEDVAGKFGTPVAENYQILGRELLLAISFSKDEEKIAELIQQGADVNYIGHPVLDPYSNTTPLMYVAAKYASAVSPYINIVKLLLNAGANPNLKIVMDSSGNRMTALEYVSNYGGSRSPSMTEKREAIKKLFETAMQK